MTQERIYEREIMGIGRKDGEKYIEQALCEDLDQPEPLIGLLLYIRSIAIQTSDDPDSFLVNEIDRLMESSFRFSKVYRDKEREIVRNHFKNYIAAVESGDYKKSPEVELLP